MSVSHQQLRVASYGRTQLSYIVCFYLLRPKSRGRIAITSADPAAPPEIHPGYLSHPDDLVCMRDGVRLTHRIAQTKPLADWDAGAISPVAEDLASDDAIDAWVRASSNTIFHPTGSCAMGTGPAAGAVTGARLCVHGLAGLCVADASIMPAIVGGNTSAPAMMIAEKAAAMLLT